MQLGYFLVNLLRYDEINPGFLQATAIDTETILIYTFLALAFCYSCAVSYLAYRQSGKAWMLFLPQWIDAGSGVSRRLRGHGMAAFTLLLIATMLVFSALD